MFDELKIAQKAIELGLISKSQLDESLKIQNDLDSLGMVSKSLNEILISKNYITQEDWQGIHGNFVDFDTDVLNNSNHQTVEIQEESSFEDTQTSLHNDIIPKKSFPVIDGYQIIRELGKGAMGSVYEGTQISMERKVAIKVLDKLLSEDKSLVERFTLESKTIARLNHENIISGIDAGITKDKIHYFVMEYVEGKSIGDILDNVGKIDILECVDILLKISNALEYAHEEGIIHRDIKPDNIILMREGSINKPKLCDLGLVRDCGSDSRLTLEGHAIGTPHYISPEQARGLRDQIDHRSDIYSLGATFYHMVAGSPPFPQKNPAVVCAMHATKPFPHPHTLDASIPKEICQIIDRCTHKKPNKRYQSCGQIIKDLKSFSDNYSPFQDDDEQITQTYDHYNDDDDDNNNNNYDDDEVQKPLTFLEENTTLSTRRHKKKRRSNQPLQPIKVQQVAVKEHSKGFIALVIFLMLALFAGAGFIAIRLFFVKNSKQNTKNTNTVAQEDPFDKIKIKILSELPQIKSLNKDNSEEITEALATFMTLKGKYKNKEKIKQKALRFLREEEDKFKKTLRSEAKQSFDTIIPEVERLTILWNGGSKNSLRIAHSLLKTFPQGLLGYTEEIGKRIKEEEESIVEELSILQNNDQSKIEKFRKQKDYPNAKKIYQNILAYTLDEIETKRQLGNLEEEYERYQKKIWKKHGREFREGIDKPLILGSKNYKKARTHCKSYISKKGFEVVAEKELSNLQHYIKIIGHLQKSISTEKKLKRQKTSKLLRSMSIEVNEGSIWALGVACIEYKEWKKAFSILKKQKNTKIYTKFLVKKIQQDEAISLLKDLEGYKKNLQKSLKKIQSIQKYKTTSFYQQNKAKFRSLQKKIQKAYLQKYALELYFNGKLLRKKNPLQFSIAYSFENPKDLKDFWGTTNLAKIEELKLKSHGDAKQDVFEIYWKGKIKGELEVSVRIAPDTDISYNIGIAFFKKYEELEKLDKHLLLINYSLFELISHEMHNKMSNAIEYENEIKNIQNKEKNAIMLGYTSGKASYLRLKQKTIALEEKSFKKIVNQKEIPIKVSVKNSKIRIDVEKKVIESNQIKSTKGFFGLYSNSPATFSQLKISGTFDEKWATKINNIVLENKTKYLKIANQRLK